jgi:hypothetical protein
MKYRIICTGNPDTPSNLANTVRKHFPDAKFIHKSNGYDLLTEQGLKLFQDEIANYDVFLNCSYIGIDVQQSLLKLTFSKWFGRGGHVFNIGSIVEFMAQFHDPLVLTKINADIPYMNSKLNLKKASAILGSSDFKSTYVILGGFKDISDATDPRMDPDRILETIEWILNSEEFTVPIIGVVGPMKTPISL